MTVAYSDQDVTVEVTSDGSLNSDRGQRVVTPGHGIIGMRERVAVFGGEFQRGASCGRRLPGRRAAPVRWRPIVIRVVVADDQAFVRAGFRVLIDASPDLEAIAETARRGRGRRPAGCTVPTSC